MRVWRPASGGRRMWLLVGVLLVAVASAGGWLLTRDTSAAAQTTTATVTSGTYKTTVSASGTVSAAREADLDFAVGGTVTDVLVEAGDKVAKGEVLATVDRSSLRAALTAARSASTAARSQLSDDVDADASDTQLAADRVAVTSAESDVESAEDDLAAGQLRATIAGTVASVDLEKGDQVSGSAQSGSASPSDASSGSTGSTGSTGGTSSGGTTSDSSAVTVVSSKAYVVEGTVAAADVASVRKGLQAQVTVTGLDDTVYGTVSSVGLVAETSSSGAAEFPVTIAVTGSPKGLYAGSSADASIVVKQVSDVLTVPTQALHTSGGSTYVTQVEGGQQVRTVVRTGAAYGMQTEVRSGLKAGDTVVVASFRRPTGTGSGQGGGQQGGQEGQQGGPPGMDGGQPPGGQGGQFGPSGQGGQQQGGGR